MKNLADIVESFIIDEFTRQSEDMLLMQRNEIAERMACAPSQVSYVLSTRFTPERGYVVESRRGNKGFVRIIRIGGRTEAQKKLATPEGFVEYLEQNSVITGRERQLLDYMLGVIDADDDKKIELLRQAVARLQGAGRR